MCTRGRSHMLYVHDLLFEVLLRVLRRYHVPECLDELFRDHSALLALREPAAAVS